MFLEKKIKRKWQIKVKIRDNTNALFLGQFEITILQRGIDMIFPKKNDVLIRTKQGIKIYEYMILLIMFFLRYLSFI